MKSLMLTRCFLIALISAFAYNAQATPILGCAIPGASTNYTIECASALGKRFSNSINRSVNRGLVEQPYTLLNDSAVELNAMVGDELSLYQILQLGDAGAEGASVATQLVQIAANQTVSSSLVLTGTGAGYNGSSAAPGSGKESGSASTGGSSSESLTTGGAVSSLVLVDATDVGPSLTPILTDPSAFGLTGKTIIQSIIKGNYTYAAPSDFGDVISAVMPHSLNSGGDLPGLSGSDGSNMLAVVAIPEPNVIMVFLLGLIMMMFVAVPKLQKVSSVK